MYSTGIKANFENRLHQLPSSGSDLILFKTESYGYQSGERFVLEKWDKEYQKRLWMISGVTGSLII